MERETARQTIRASWRQILPQITAHAQQPVNGEPSFICPKCGHGAHGDGLTFDPNSPGKETLHCFACGFSGDVIALYMEYAGAGYNDALAALAGMIGETIDSPAERIHGGTRTNRTAAPARTAPARADQSGAPSAAEQTPAPAPADYSAYYAACAERLPGSPAADYLKARGISMDTATAYRIGFDPAADPTAAPGATGKEYKPHPAPRVIVPVNDSFYLARALDPAEKMRYANPNRKAGAGAAGIFNEAALYAEGVKGVFVTEGAFDALSILEAGQPAIALNSTQNAQKLLDRLKDKPTKATLLLCLDNDDAGRTAAEKLTAGLKQQGIDFSICDIYGDLRGMYKDPNEFLTKDGAAFVAAVSRESAKCTDRPHDLANYYITEFAADLKKNAERISTGFKNLDEKAGGIYTGLYVIAAISSLGKTTFASQLADHIAAGGRDVLFFSLEQSRLEMFSKGIAREMFRQNPATARNSLQIRQSGLDGQTAEAAANYLCRIEHRLSIIEGNFSFSLESIVDYCRRYVDRTGTRPAVFIDYLQILQTDKPERPQSAREQVDNTVTTLKRLSRDLNLPVFIISSVNRSNYLTPIDFESLKESGGIEYTADVIWGLQLNCLNEEIFSKSENIKAKRDRVKEAKEQNPRSIELRCLKNRFGVSSFSCFFNYYPANETFIPYQPDQIGTGNGMGRR